MKQQSRTAPSNSLVALTRLALDGGIPECAREAFYGASLCALRKKDGGLRPIAIGSVYRRLPCRIAAHHAASLLSPDFRPVQLGVATRQGCEVAVHAAREFMAAVSDSSPPMVLVKVDVRNAFNSVRRDVLLRNIRSRCPEIYRLAFQAYSAPTPLHIGDHTIWSCRGIQQGDPLGPVGFSLAVDDCARSMRSPLNVWYLDDATLAGPVDIVTKDLHVMRDMLPDLGLELNGAKCEVTVLGEPSGELHSSTLAAVQSALPGVTETPLEQLNLLGAPLDEAGSRAAKEAAGGTISRMCERIRALDSHTAVFFLTHHTSAPRLQYLLRSSPMYKNPNELRDIDEMVRATLTDVCNVDIADRAWIQATLPTRHGGLGVRSVERLALPCYIASLTSATPLIASVIPTVTDNGTASSALELAQNCFRSQTGIITLPNPSVAHQQWAWDDAASTAIRDQLISGTDQVHRARLLASCQPHTAAWLQAVPVPNLGLHLDPETVRIAVALRIGAPICEPHACRLCARPIGRQGHHALSCKKSAGRFPRHAQLNDLMKRSLSTAGIPSVLEPVGLDRGDGKRPDGLTTFPFKGGKCLAWDATCCDTFADSVLTGSALNAGTAARAAEKRKMQRYLSIATQYSFVPLAVETTGVIGPAATRLIKELGRMLTSATGDQRETAWLWQRVSIAIIRGNAAAIRGSAPQTASHPPVIYNSVNCRPAYAQLTNPPIADKRQNSSTTPSMTPSPEPTNSDHTTAGNDVDCSSGNDGAEAENGSGGSGNDNGDGVGEDIDTARDTTDPGKHGKDPLHIGLPNLGNSCYQNATLQLLLGLRPFLSEVTSLSSRPQSDQCRTLHAIAKLITLRQKSLGKSVSRHLIDLRDVFAEIDPAFRGTEMQDASEFLLRLLDVMKDEVDASVPTANPVRNNFQYRTIESCMCTKCSETVLKRQENICWFVRVPHRQGNQTPTLQDAIRLSMRPDRRELLCQRCHHSEFLVTRKISQLPKTLILQLNRYVFLGEDSKKIRDSVGIPKFLSLDEYVADDVNRPPAWKCRQSSRCTLSDCRKSVQPEHPSSLSSSSPAPPSTSPSTTAATADPTWTPSPARPSSPKAAAEAGSSPAILPPPADPPLVVLDSQSDQKPKRSREDEDKLQEATTRFPEEREPANPEAIQAQLSESCVEGDQSRCSVDLAGSNTYRLVGMVSHLGGATHSGHYVSDVYSLGRNQ